MSAERRQICCGYLEKRLETRSSSSVRRWFTLEQEGDTGLAVLSYTAKPPPTVERAEIAQMSPRRQAATERMKKLEVLAAQPAQTRRQVYHNEQRDWVAKGGSFELGATRRQLLSPHADPAATAASAAVMAAAAAPAIPGGRSATTEPEPEPEPQPGLSLVYSELWKGPEPKPEPEPDERELSKRTAPRTSMSALASVVSKAHHAAAAGRAPVKIVLAQINVVHVGWEDSADGNSSDFSLRYQQAYDATAGGSRSGKDLQDDEVLMCRASSGRECASWVGALRKVQKAQQRLARKRRKEQPQGAAPAAAAAPGAAAAKANYLTEALANAGISHDDNWGQQTTEEGVPPMGSASPVATGAKPAASSVTGTDATGYVLSRSRGPREEKRNPHSHGSPRDRHADKSRRAAAKASRSRRSTRTSLWESEVARSPAAAADDDEAADGSSSPELRALARAVAAERQSAAAAAATSSIEQSPLVVRFRDPFGRPMAHEQHEAGLGLGQFRAPRRAEALSKHHGVNNGLESGGFNNPELHAFASPNPQVSFDMGQPYVISTVTGTAFDVGTPAMQKQHWQRPSVAASLPTVTEPSAADSFEKRLQSALEQQGVPVGVARGGGDKQTVAASMAVSKASAIFKQGLADTEAEGMEAVLRDPIKAENFKEYAALQLEETVMATTLPPIRGTAQTMIGNFTYEFRNVRPKSFMIPHERLQVGLDPSQADGKAVLITCEELALTTEPFLYTVQSKLINDEGKAFAGFQELTMQIRFDMGTDGHGRPMAQNALAQVVVGPLDMAIEEGGKKNAGNHVINHANHKLQKRMEVELNAHIQKNLEPMCAKLNAQLQAQVSNDIQQRAAAITLSNRDSEANDRRMMRHQSRDQ